VATGAFVVAALEWSIVKCERPEAAARIGQNQRFNVDSGSTPIVIGGRGAVFKKPGSWPTDDRAGSRIASSAPLGFARMAWLGVVGDSHSLRRCGGQARSWD